MEGRKVKIKSPDAASGPRRLWTAAFECRQTAKNLSTLRYDADAIFAPFSPFNSSLTAPCQPLKFLLF